MRSLVYCLALAGGALLAAAAVPALLSVNAAQNPASERVVRQTAELLVFEAKGCAYCFVFRRDVVPDYMRSPRARDIPMRFIDVKKADLTRLSLSAPLTLLPTVVLMSHGREVDRISGYMGPEPFFHMVSRLKKMPPLD